MKRRIRPWMIMLAVLVVAELGIQVAVIIIAARNPVVPTADVAEGETP